MTFNDDARLDASRVRRGGRGGTGIAVGGGAALVLFLLSQLLGVDLTGLAPTTGEPVEQGTDTSLAEECRTGADANENVDCRMVGAYNSLDDYWATAFPRLGGQYVSPGMYLESGQWQTGCGTASSAMGPFYCPADETIYIDTAFYDQLDREMGAGGDFARYYVIAHEYGHHIQHLTGIAGQVRSFQQSSPSQANQAQVLMELQADCYAGAWAGKNRDAIEPGDFEEGMTAASAIGDDTLMRRAGREVSPESFTHGTSAQRMQALRLALDSGDDSRCDEIVR